MSKRSSWLNCSDHGHPRSEIIRKHDLTALAFDKWTKYISIIDSKYEKNNRTIEEQDLIRLRKENQQLRKAKPLSEHWHPWLWSDSGNDAQTAQTVWGRGRTRETGAAGASGGRYSTSIRALRHLPRSRGVRPDTQAYIPQRGPYHPSDRLFFKRYEGKVMQEIKNEYVSILAQIHRDGTI